MRNPFSWQAGRRTLGNGAAWYLAVCGVACHRSSPGTPLRRNARQNVRTRVRLKNILDRARHGGRLGAEGRVSWEHQAGQEEARQDTG
jgi:hypothetical protein